MNWYSLFKVQSLVAIALFTSLNAGAGTNSTGSQTSDKSTSGSNNDQGISDFCASHPKLSNGDCTVLMTDALSSNVFEANSTDRQCRDTSDRANQLQSTASDQLNQYFQAINQKLDAIGGVQKAQIAAKASTANALAVYNTAIADINLKLPGEVAQARSKAAQQLLALRGEMLKLGSARQAAEQARTDAYSRVEEAMTSLNAQCTTFASSKANSKIDAFDKAYNDLKGKSNIFVNNGTSSLAGAQNRRNAKRARDAQLAYMSAYKNCMAGKGDPNGGEPGPGPLLVKAIQDAQNKLPAAEKAYQAALKDIEDQKALINQQIAQLESDTDQTVKAIAAAAQSAMNQALTTYQTAVNSAQASVDTASVDVNLKGPMWDQQAQSAQQQASLAAARAQSANIAAAGKCGDPTMAMNNQQNLVQPVRTGTKGVNY